MAECSHQNLVLLPGAKRKVQCRHCHLTILVDDLVDDYCPECYEADGWKRYDFETVASQGSDAIRYRCEQCNAVIASERLDDA